MPVPPMLVDTARRAQIRSALVLDRALRKDSLVTRLADALRRGRINCVIDVGANIGQYGRLLRAIGYHERICSFEPVAANFRTLAARAARDGRGSWRAFNMALGREAETAPINVSAITHFSSFLARTDFSDQQYGAHAATHSISH